MIKKISVQQLRIGMFVCGNNRKWLETPFFRTKFLVNADQQIEHLKQYCQFVYIDTEKGLDLEESAAENPLSILESQQGDSDPIRKLYFDSVAKLNELKKGALPGRPPDANALGKIVDTLSPSIGNGGESLVRLTLEEAEGRDAARRAVDDCILGLALAVRLRLNNGQVRALATKLLMESTDVAVEDKAAQAKKSSWLLAPEDIVAVVSAFSALRAHEFCRSQSPVVAALQYLQSGRRPELDSYLVKKLIETIGLYPAGSIVELSNGQLAIVTDTRVEPPCICLRVVTDAQKKLLDQYHLLELPGETGEALVIVGTLAFDDPIVQLIMEHCEMMACEA